MSENQPKVISIEEIRERAKGIVVPIPDWDGKGTIHVRLKAVDMTPHLMSLKTMPNVLKKDAIDAFEKGIDEKELVDKLDSGMFNELEAVLPIIDGVVKDCLVEPKFEDIQKEYPLTQAQKMAIFDFAMRGVDALRPFRAGRGEDVGVSGDSTDV